MPDGKEYSKRQQEKWERERQRNEQLKKQVTENAKRYQAETQPPKNAKEREKYFEDMWKAANPAGARKHERQIRERERANKQAVDKAKAQQRKYKKQQDAAKAKAKKAARNAPAAAKKDDGCFVTIGKGVIITCGLASLLRVRTGRRRRPRS